MGAHKPKKSKDPPTTQKKKHSSSKHTPQQQKPKQPPPLEEALAYPECTLQPQWQTLHLHPPQRPPAQVLDPFWSLAAKDDATRSNAGNTLLQLCFHSNQSENQKESQGMHMHVMHAGYTLQRLIHGLTSGREGARVGYSACLASFLTLAYGSGGEFGRGMLRIMQQCTTTSTKHKDEEEKEQDAAGDTYSWMDSLEWLRTEMIQKTHTRQISVKSKQTKQTKQQLQSFGGNKNDVLGHLFGVMAIVRSNILQQAIQRIQKDNEDDGWESGDGVRLQKLLHHLARDLTETYPYRTWIQPLVYQALVEYLTHLHQSSWKAAFSNVVHDVVLPRFLLHSFKTKKSLVVDSSSGSGNGSGNDEESRKEVQKHWSPEQWGIALFLQRSWSTNNTHNSNSNSNSKSKSKSNSKSNSNSKPPFPLDAPLLTKEHLTLSPHPHPHPAHAAASFASKHLMPTSKSFPQISFLWSEIQQSVMMRFRVLGVDSHDMSMLKSTSMSKHTERLPESALMKQSPAVETLEAWMHLLCHDMLDPTTGNNHKRQALALTLLKDYMHMHVLPPSKLQAWVLTERLMGLLRRGAAASGKKKNHTKNHTHAKMESESHGGGGGGGGKRSGGYGMVLALADAVMEDLINGILSMDHHHHHHPHEEDGILQHEKEQANLRLVVLQAMLEEEPQWDVKHGKKHVERLLLGQAATNTTTTAHAAYLSLPPGSKKDKREDGKNVQAKPLPVEHTRRLLEFLQELACTLISELLQQQQHVEKETSTHFSSDEEDDDDDDEKEKKEEEEATKKRRLLYKVEGLMEVMMNLGVKQHRLATAVPNTTNDDDDEEEEDEGTMEKDKEKEIQEKKEREGLCLQVMGFLMSCAFFQCDKVTSGEEEKTKKMHKKKKEKNDKEAFSDLDPAVKAALQLSQLPHAAAIPQEIRFFCSSRFFSLLADVCAGGGRLVLPNHNSSSSSSSSKSAGPEVPKALQRLMQAASSWSALEAHGAVLTRPALEEEEDEESQAWVGQMCEHTLEILKKHDGEKASEDSPEEKKKIEDKKKKKKKRKRKSSLSHEEGEEDFDEAKKSASQEASNQQYSKLKCASGLSTLALALHLQKLRCGVKDPHTALADDEDDLDEEVNDSLEELHGAFQWLVLGQKPPREENSDSEEEEEKDEEFTLASVAEVCVSVLSIQAEADRRGASMRLLRDAVKHTWSGCLAVAASAASSSLDGGDAAGASLVVDEDTVRILVEAVCGEETMGGGAEDEEEGEEEDEGEGDMDQDSDEDDDGEEERLLGSSETRKAIMADSNDFKLRKSKKSKENDKDSDDDEKEEDEGEEEEEEDVELNQEELGSMLLQENDKDNSALEHSAGADAALGQLLKFKQQSRKSGQMAEQRTMLSHRIRCVSLLEELLSKFCRTGERGNTSLITIEMAQSMLLPLLQCSQELEKQLNAVEAKMIPTMTLGSGDKQPPQKSKKSDKIPLSETKTLFARVAAMMQAKLTKVRPTFPSESDADRLDAMKETFKQTAEAIVTHAKAQKKSVTHSEFCGLALSLLIKWYPSCKFTFAKEAFHEAMKTWTKSKHSNIEPTLFQEVMVRHPAMAIAGLVEDMAVGAKESRSRFVRGECFRLVGELFALRDVVLAAIASSSLQATAKENDNEEEGVAEKNEKVLVQVDTSLRAALIPAAEAVKSVLVDEKDQKGDSTIPLLKGPKKIMEVVACAQALVYFAAESRWSEREDQETEEEEQEDKAESAKKRKKIKKTKKKGDKNQFSWQPLQTILTDKIEPELQAMVKIRDRGAIKEECQTLLSMIEAFVEGKRLNREEEEGESPAPIKPKKKRKKRSHRMRSRMRAEKRARLARTKGHAQ